MTMSVSQFLIQFFHEIATVLHAAILQLIQF